MGDNITLSVSEVEEVQEELTNQYVEWFENNIPDDAMTIAVKYNYSVDTSLNNFNDDIFFNVLSYLRDSGVDIIACSTGVHFQGERGIPHSHFHLICHRFKQPANPSGHRRRWTDKQDISDVHLEGLSFKYKTLDTSHAKYEFLAYPLKEGNEGNFRFYRLKGKQMPRHCIEFLKQVGNAIYQRQVALRLRQDKCAERKQLALSELYELVRDMEFSSFRQMMEWLDDNYISKLPLEEYPDPKNYKTNCQKIAVKKGILKYSDL